VAVAAALDGAVGTQKSSKAQASTLDAITLMTALIRTKRLACRSTVASETLASAFMANSTFAAAAGATYFWNFSQCRKFPWHIDGWRCTLGRVFNKFEIDYRTLINKLFARVTREACFALALALETKSLAGAVIHAALVLTRSSIESSLAHACPINAHPTTIAVMRTAWHVTHQADPAWFTDTAAICLASAVTIASTWRGCVGGHSGQDGLLGLVLELPISQCNGVFIIIDGLLS